MRIRMFGSIPARNRGQPKRAGLSAVQAAADAALFKGDRAHRLVIALGGAALAAGVPHNNATAHQLKRVAVS